MRAPPEAATETSGTRFSVARSHDAYELLPDDAAHRPAHEGEVHDRELARLTLDLSRTAHDRVAETGLDLRLGEPLRVRTQVEELERIGRA